MAEVVIDIIGRDNFSSTLGNFGSIITGIESAVNLVGQAFNAAVGAITPFLNSAMESEDAIANLNATLQSTGGAVGLTSQQLQDMATGLQEVTRFSDETIINGEAMLLTFTSIGQDIFPLATEAMLNLAEKMGSDVSSAAIQLGKALNDPVDGVTALRRVGVQLTDTQRDMIAQFVEMGDIESAQKIILQELQVEFGGLASAMGDTFAGRIEILKNQFDNLRETIGNAIMPILTDLMNLLIDHMPTLETFANAIADWLTELRDSGVIQDFANKVFDLLDKVTRLATAFVDAGVNSTEFRDALANILGDNFSIDAQDIVDFLDRLDAQMAEAVRAKTAAGDWGESGDAFGEMIASLFTGDGIHSQDSQLIPALGEAINQWFLGAMGVADWQQAQDTMSGILQQIIIQPILDLPQETADAISVVLNNMMDAFRNTGSTMFDMWLDIGRHLIEGFKAGIFWDIDAFMAELQRLWNDIVVHVKNAFGIASRSTVFFSIGQNIIQGLIDGVSSMFDSVVTLFGNLLDAILSPFAPLLDFIGVDLGTTGTVGGRIPSTGGGTTGTEYNPRGGTTDTTGTGTGGNTFNFYGTVNVGSMEELVYDCLNPNPTLTSLGTVPGGL